MIAVATQDEAIRQIENHFRKSRRKIYVVLEEFHLEWKTSDILMFQKFWYRGFSLKWIAEYFGRDIDEMAVVVMDQARRGYIRPRPSGIFCGPETQPDANVKKRIAKMKILYPETYMLFEDTDFYWDERDVLQFDRMWNEGYSLEDIATYFRRHEDEIALLVIDRARKGYIN
ncbi:hypothetical protein [Parageobacillus thermoglucosidasius]|uniref:hypothetical protein n=1 Tax=Parageobacillus thermoglucosidasius TaxID=1426 RepID=UPI002E221464|nr:hypothetical protein [Parageobacillus thermoglucosidasius]MED4946466.1 hypothetical protein [Parageobacillus thermoglucosidasius]MED4984027.1 hypothetical protein [Parageobacillus thermoglucosidasius]